MYVIRRSSHNPLISPITDKQWEARGTFNPSPGQSRQHHAPPVSRAGAARRADDAGGHLDHRQSAHHSTASTSRTAGNSSSPPKSGNKYGCEDPRVTFFEGKYYIFYTALGGMPFGPGNIKVACAISKDLETIEERHLITPFNAKAMALFPERVNGKITVMLYRAHRRAAGPNRHRAVRPHRGAVGPRVLGKVACRVRRAHHQPAALRAATMSRWARRRLRPRTAGCSFTPTSKIIMRARTSASSASRRCCSTSKIRTR